MEPQRIAIIDLGTNTFHLMIAERRDQSFSVLLRERVAVKIGMGGMHAGVITEEGLARAISAMRHFKEVMSKNDVKLAMAFGTSALRNSKNGGDVARQLADVLGFPVNIISGEQEAEYIYRGVREAVPMGDQISLIVDIGGGSVEFIIGDGAQIFWKHSFEIGAQRLLEQFQKHDPILTKEIQLIYEYLEKKLPSLLIELKKYNPKVMVGSSGTFDTLSEMYCLQNAIPYSEDFPETPLTLESFAATFGALKERNREQRLEMPGMIEMRADMIVVACCLIDFLLLHHDFHTIRVSTWSLKEGVLATI